MMNKFIVTVGVSILSVLAQAQGAIDGFFKEKGELDLAFTGTYNHGPVYYGGTFPINYERNQVILSGYATYGITDRFNVIGSLPFINFLPQDAGLYVKYSLTNPDKFTLAPALGVTFPLFPYETESGQSIGQRAVTIQPKLVAQYKTKYNLFVQGQGGYNYALDPVPSSYTVSGKVGYGIKNWYFDIWYDYQYGIGGKDYGTDSEEPLSSFRELGVSYSRVGGVIYLQLNEKTGVFMNSAYVLSGRNTSKYTSFGAGVVLKWK